MKAWKTEAFEQNYIRKKLWQYISQNSLKRTFDEVTAWYLTEKKLHHKCFSTTFIKFSKIAILWKAGEQLFLKE